MNNDEALSIAKESRNFADFMRGMSSLRNVDDGLLRAGLSINDAARALGIVEWRDFRGLSVIDLGCGSRLVHRSGKIEGWPPYYCLLMANLDAIVKGVDIVPADIQDVSYYDHVIDNLVLRLKSEGDLSSIIAQSSVNVVNTNMLAQLKPVSANLRETLERERLNVEWFSSQLEIAIMQMLVNGGVWINDLETKVK